MQTKAVTIVASKPVVSPAQRNAKGIDRMPDPNDAFNKWVKVSQSLKTKQNKLIIVTLTLWLIFNAKNKTR